MSSKIVLDDKLTCLLVTANVGSLFENLKDIEEPWVNEFLKVIERHKADFVALHCQEIGGKDCKTSFAPVLKFFKKLANLNELKDFTIVHGILDGDVNENDHFTALGSIYLVRRCVKDVAVYDFKNKKYFELTGKSFYSSNIADLSYVQKEKFDQEFYPEIKWTRKGYCRVRWKICNRIIELVNIHLFHDDSNLTAVGKSPSPYAVYRANALKYVMNKLRNDDPLNGEGSLFLFGDFNFRLDLKSLVQSLSSTSREQVVRSENDDLVRIVYRREPSNGDCNQTDVDCDQKLLVKLEKKFFEINHERFQPTVSYQKELRNFDKELSDLDLGLHECDITFPPTYPYSESKDSACRYMPTRCPSWCDRILFSQQASELIHSKELTSNVMYGTIGDSVCMGDHKPVFLAFTVSATSSLNDSSEKRKEVLNSNGQETTV